MRKNISMSTPRSTTPKLKGPHLLDPVDEGDDDITHMIQATFPSLCI